MAKKRKSRGLLIKGQPWKVRWLKLHGNEAGLCDHEKREIMIDTSQKYKPEYKLDVLIHETIHACFPDLSEESVDEAATSIAHIVYAQRKRWMKDER